MGRACPTCSTPREQQRCPGCRRLVGSPCALGCTWAPVSYAELELAGGEPVEPEASAAATELDLGAALDAALADWESAA